jgi:hypothetical protein
MIAVLDILKIAGFSATPRSGLVRHQHDRYPAEELRRHGWLEPYQSNQGRSVFHHVDHIVACYGVHGTRAAFDGVYQVLCHRPASEGRTLSVVPGPSSGTTKPDSSLNLSAMRALMTFEPA